MNYPPLQPLHSANSLSQVKLNLYARLTTDELKLSLEPEQPGALKARNDGTIIDGHHRIEILRERGIDVDQLPREVVPKS
jgi:hypothetical protein